MNRITAKHIWEVVKREREKKEREERCERKKGKETALLATFRKQLNGR